ncbi:SusC/RagA family TonB-linked outer membrane protein [Parafilimonas terrae]|uniref:TonB-linked outer membrane protein, SusC/RagA family n=1 Tax=Parafilimonas terrae TaxID=1465490 RepID=A0A1I5WVF7_9BACT|nr:TonB-dependent receptor [Parafilimonas terrae]SFQ23785.1 TonB-linked outer membrane protein, SusC/RagA family [Parafilimonas terrae]
MIQIRFLRNRYAGKLTHLLLLLLILSTTTVNAQSTQVSGKITSNESDSAVSGATIAVKGGKAAVAADDNGNFKITAAPNAILVISAIGYATQEVPVGNQTNITVHLISGTQSLEQVVVVGYGTQKRKDVTGSIASISAATIEKVPVTTLDQAMQGRAPGVQIINNDAAPGGNVSVMIRGIGSLASGGNSPLYVVDGYPTTGGINNINPNDIASIDVLKDASATAIYGIRAANGVVIITTKKGSKGKMQVSVDALASTQTKPKEYNLLNARDWATLSNEVEEADLTGTYTGLPIWHTPDQLHNVDWQDAVYRTGLTQNYTIGIRGGSDKVQAAMSFGYYDQKGIVLASYFKRYTLNLNLDYQATSWLKSSTSVKYTYQNSNTALGSGTNGLFQLAINPPTMDSGSRLTTQIKDANGNYGFYNPINSNVKAFGNPVYSIENNQYQNETNYILATSSLEATIYDGLKIKTNVGANVSNYTGFYLQPEDNRASLQYPGTIVTPANYHQTSSKTFEWLWENTISYDKTFGSHTINFVGGISAQKNTWTGMGGGGIPPNSVTRDLSLVSNLVLDANIPGTNTGNGQNIYTLASEFARITYQFADKYMLTATIRRDGSSKFDTGHKYGTFPSAAIGWRVKNESFLKDARWISDLKIRASYGEVGNESPIGLFQYQSLYAGNYASNVNGPDAAGNPRDNLGYPFNKIYQNGIAQVQPANPTLKWETDKQTDIGLDAAFLNGALTFTADWFNRDSKDFLLRLKSPAQTGYSNITRNVGSMNNRGWEFALNYNGSAGKDFRYGAGVTLTTIKNKLTSITSGTDFVTNFGGLNLNGFQEWNEFSRSYVGKPVGEFFGYKAIGIYQSQEQIDALNAKAPGGIYRPGTVARPGDRYFADITGDGIVNDDDRGPIGNPQPKFFGGLNLDASYKGWDINIYFYGSFGNKILNYVESNLESFAKRGSEGAQNVSEAYYKNHWTPDNPSNRYARAVGNGGDNSSLNNVPSNVWIEDGSFVKLKNVSIGYTFPESWLGRFAITKTRLYISSQNLFFISKYSGLDPEIGIQGGNATQNGVDAGTYPSSRYFSFGLNVTF